MGCRGIRYASTDDAACDEIHHAALCAHLASRHLRRRIRPTLPNGGLRAPLGGFDGVRRIATESWIDGCLGEGIAARHAAQASARATDGAARAVQRRIAEDERRHADLAWDILEWACSRGGDDIRDAVYALRDAEPENALHELSPDGLERHGRLPASVLDDIARDGVERSRRRFAELYADVTAIRRPATIEKRATPRGLYPRAVIEANQSH